MLYNPSLHRLSRNVRDCPLCPCIRPLFRFDDLTVQFDRIESVLFLLHLFDCKKKKEISICSNFNFAFLQFYMTSALLY